MNTLSIPIFPLHTVLFPNGALPLRIFEPRYLDMISTCMKGGDGFGICLIKEGSEVGQAAETYETGTLSEISYFNIDTNGMLCITAQGKQRFHILSKSVQANQLTIAEQVGDRLGDKREVERVIVANGGVFERQVVAPTVFEDVGVVAALPDPLFDLVA